MNRYVRALAAGAALLPLGCRERAERLEVSGTVEIRELALAPLASGRLARLLKDEGDTVHRGDTIAVLEQPGLDALIAQRRAQARASVLRVHEVAAAQADSARAANELARAEPLRAQTIISEQQYDALQSAAVAAAARLATARATGSEAAAATAALAVTLAIRDQLTVLAPEEGVVLTRYLDAGEALAAGTPVVSLGLVRRPWIRAYVGDRYLARLKLEQRATVHLDGFATGLPGRIVDISARAEFTPRAALTERERADLVFGIKVALDGGDAGGRVKAGMPVTVDLRPLP